VHFRSPTHRLSASVLGVLRRLGVRLSSVVSESSSGEAAIVVADGSPDNVIMAILALCMDHSGVVDILFPEYKHLSVLDRLASYVDDLGYRKVLVTIDQESYGLDELTDRIASKMSEVGASMIEDRGLVKVFAYLRGGRRAVFIFCVNGLPEYPSSRHSIEDHLIMLAQRLNVASAQPAGDSKSVWSRLSREEELEVFKAVISCSRDLLHSVFKQQVEALTILQRE